MTSVPVRVIRPAVVIVNLVESTKSPPVLAKGILLGVSPDTLTLGKVNVPTVVCGVVWSRLSFQDKSGAGTRSSIHCTVSSFIRPEFETSPKYILSIAVIAVSLAVIACGIVWSSFI